MARLCMVSQNVMAADTAGSIYYGQYGRCPRRPPGFPTDRPVPGWRPDAEWGEPAPLEELPQIVNPPYAPVMQNCNVAAFLTTPEHVLDHSAYPPWVLYGHVGDAYRPRGYRAITLLHREGMIGLEKARRIAMDCYVMAAEPWVAALRAAEAAHGAEVPDSDGCRPQAIDLLVRWDGYARVDSIGPAVLKFWRLEYLQLQPDINADNEHLRVPRSAEERRDALRALDKASRYLRERVGRLDVPWGSVKRLRRGNRAGHSAVTRSRTWGCALCVLPKAWSLLRMVTSSARPAILPAPLRRSSLVALRARVGIR